MTTRSTSAERILVLLEEDDGGPLEAAADLAARRGLQLVGLFIEDVDLLSSAGLPFAREIGLASGIARPLVAEEVARSMQERAERLRASIDRVARERGLEAVFHVGRGRRTHTVLGTVRPQDVLVVRRGGWSRPSAHAIEGVLVQARCAVMLVEAERPAVVARTGPMVLIDGSPGSTRALARAIALARAGPEPVTLVTMPGGADAGAVEAAREMLDGYGVESRLLALPRATLAELVRTTRAERPHMLLVSRDSPLLRESPDPWWLELQGLPVVLVP